MYVEWDNECHMSLDLIKEQFPLGTGGWMWLLFGEFI